MGRCGWSGAILIMLGLPWAGIAHGNKTGAEIKTLIEKANKLSDIRAAGSVPFHLHAKFVFWNSPGEPVDGTYTLDWASSTKWREQFETPSFHEIKIGNAGNIWLSRSESHESLAEYHVVGVLSFALSLKRQLEPYADQPSKLVRSIGADKATCVETHSRRLNNHRFCFDAASGAFVYNEDSQGSSGADRAIALGSYQSLGSHLFPRQIIESEKGAKVLRIEVDSLSQVREIASSLFDPPAGAASLPGCQDPDPPIPLKNPEPPYPKDAPRQHLQGIVYASLKVGADGRVHDAAVLESSSSDFASATVDIVKNRWQFKPSTCNGEPVPSEVLLETSFRFW